MTPLYFSSLSLLRTALHYLNAWNRLAPETLSCSRQFFFFIDRYYRGEDLPTAGSQKSTEQLCGGRRGGCWKAFLSWRVKRPLSFEWGHNQRHSWQVSTCAFYVLKMVLSSTILQNVSAEVFQDPPVANAMCAISKNNWQSKMNCCGNSLETTKWL